MQNFSNKSIIIAFREVNNKIDELWLFIKECCSKIPINIGNGVGLFKRLNTQNKWEFKSLVQGSNIRITEQDNTITISSTGGSTITCEDIDTCLGISPLGNPAKLLNEQGDFITVSGSGFTCSDLNICDTDNLNEGNTNLYFTNSRAVSALTGEDISILTNNTGYITNSALSPYLLSSTAASTYQPIGSYLTSAITSLNGLTNSTQTFVNDTNVTIASTGTTHTLGWTGTLADARIASASTWNAKQNALGFTPENTANKQTTTSIDVNHYYNAPYINTLVSTIPSVVYKTGSIVDTVASATERAIIVIPMDADSNNYLYRFFHYARTSAATASVRIRIGTYASPINGAVGADAIGNQTQLALLTLSNNNRNTFIRNLTVNGGVGGSIISFLASNGTTQNDETTAATPTTTSIDTTTQYYLYISLVTAVGLTYTSDATTVTKTKLN